MPPNTPDDATSSFALSMKKLLADCKGQIEVSAPATDFEVVHQKYRQGIYKFLAHMIGDDAIAEDLTQETFVNAWQKLGTLKDENMMKSWLYQIARNKARDHFRRERLKKWIPWSEKLESVWDASPLKVAGPEEHIPEMHEVQRILMQLHLEERESLWLYHIEGWKQGMIAKVFCVSEREVRRRLKRAENKFIKLYNACSYDDEERGCV